MVLYWGEIWVTYLPDFEARQQPEGFTKRKNSPSFSKCTRMFYFASDAWGLFPEGCADSRASGCTGRPRAAPWLPGLWLLAKAGVCPLGAEWPVHVLEQLEISPGVIAPQHSARLVFLKKGCRLICAFFLAMRLGRPIGRTSVRR